jgi:hypothetical protein
MATAVIAGTALCTSIANSHATVVINDDYGGYVDGYKARYAAIRASGDRVVIDGACLSACTLVLGIVPPDHVCATRNAILGFHAVRFRYLSGDVISNAATDRLMAYYPQRIQNWIARNGGLADELILLTGPELARMVPRCGA